jgi:hypothetical protein
LIQIRRVVTGENFVARSHKTENFARTHGQTQETVARAAAEPTAKASATTRNKSKSSSIERANQENS